jgi:hypothetical protein
VKSADTLQGLIFYTTGMYVGARFGAVGPPHKILIHMEFSKVILNASLVLQRKVGKGQIEQT